MRAIAAALSVLVICSGRTGAGTNGLEEKLAPKDALALCYPQIDQSALFASSWGLAPLPPSSVEQLPLPYASTPLGDAVTLIWLRSPCCTR